MPFKMPEDKLPGLQILLHKDGSSLGSMFMCQPHITILDEIEYLKWFWTSIFGYSNQTVNLPWLQQQHMKGRESEPSKSENWQLSSV